MQHVPGNAAGLQLCQGASEPALEGGAGVRQAVSTTSRVTTLQAPKVASMRECPTNFLFTYHLSLMT